MNATDAGAEIIRIRRDALNLTQAKLAKMVGVGLTTYQRYERGERELPLPAARAIAEALDISIAEIAGQVPPTTETTQAAVSTAAAVIQARRREIGLTQPRVAAAAGFPLDQYQRYESGQEEPTLAAAGALAAALDIGLDALAGLTPRAVDLGGKWWATWQGGGDRTGNIDLHTVNALRVADKLLLDNAWRGELQIFANEVLIGWYRPPAGSTRSRQGIFLWLPGSDDYLYGRWTGLSENNSVISGWCAMAREESKSREIIDELVASNTQPRPPLRLPGLSSWGAGG